MTKLAPAFSMIAIAFACTREERVPPPTTRSACDLLTQDDIKRVLGWDAASPPPRRLHLGRKRGQRYAAYF